MDQGLPLNDQLPSQLSAYSRWVHLLTYPFFSLGSIDRPLYPALPPTTIPMTSTGHMPTLPQSHPPLWYQKRVGGLYPISNYLTSLVHAQRKVLPLLSSCMEVGEIPVVLYYFYAPTYPSSHMQRIAHRVKGPCKTCPASQVPRMASQAAPRVASVGGAVDLLPEAGHSAPGRALARH